MSKAVNLDLEPGEAFLRVSVDEDGVTNFSCGFYPSNMNIEKDFDAKSDLDYDDMIAVFMAGLANLIQNDMDTILTSGFEHLLAGNKPFDFVVDASDAEYFSNLTEEQVKLLHMATKGEA
jgi:uncharacterized protein YjaZ